MPPEAHTLDGRPVPAGEVTARYRSWVLFLMALVSVLNMADRQVLSILIEPIKAELG